VKIKLKPAERSRLIRMAREAAKHAYAPYSHFRVGAAILGKHSTYVGANVENSSYGLSLCAERAALASAVVQGDHKIRGVAIACIDSNKRGVQSRLPCGACRQWMVELAPDAEILICDNNEERIFNLNELLPLPFSLGKH
jgi:cytidine deaminase